MSIEADIQEMLVLMRGINQAIHKKIEVPEVANNKFYKSGDFMPVFGTIRRHKIIERLIKHNVPVMTTKHLQVLESDLKKAGLI